MKKKLVVISKSLYILIFMALFLPAFVVPSCESENKESYTSDSTMKEESIINIPNNKDTLSKAESITHTNDADMRVNNTAMEKDAISESEINPLRFLFFPDKENYSFIGFLFFSISKGSVWLFTLFIVWSGVLRFRCKTENNIAVNSTIALLCLLASFLDDDDLVWGFWIMLGITGVTAIVNWVIKFTSKEMAN